MCTSNGVSRDGTTRDSASVPSAVTEQASQELHFAPLPPFNYIGHFCGFNGLPLFSEKGRHWVRSRTGHDFRLEMITTSTPQRPLARLLPSITSTTSDSSSQLPARYIVKQCLDQYRSSGFLYVYPALSPELFEQTIDSVYQGSNGAANLPHMACLYAFLAFACVCGLREGLELLIDGDACAKQVEVLVPGLLQMAPTLEGLQALIMLVSRMDINSANVGSLTE